MFLAILPAHPSHDVEGDRIFERGVHLASRLWGRHPRDIRQCPLARVASFAREDGSGGRIVADPQIRVWMVAMGTWWHSRGHGIGQDTRLLQELGGNGIESFAGEVEGWFGALVVDEHRQRCAVITDIVGSCHLYLRHLPSGLALSNSSLLLAALGSPVGLNPVGCQEFLEVGTIFENRTLFQDVEKLDGGSIYSIHHGRVESRIRYWSPIQLTPDRYQGESASAVLWERLTTVAKSIGSRWARPVCDLTGGYDSRTLLGAFLAGGVRLSTTVSGPPEHPDVQVAKRVANVVGVPLLHLEYRQPYSWARLREAVSLTDGECNLVDYAGIHEIHRQLLVPFDLSVNGSYGGLARGLWWEILGATGASRARFPSESLIRSRYLTQPIAPALVHPALRVPLVDHLARCVDRLVHPISQYPGHFQMDVVNLSLRIQRWQGRLASSTDRLHPCLSPFGLRSVLEPILQTSFRDRHRNRLVRRMLHRYAPTLSAIPLADGYPPRPLTVFSWWRFVPGARGLLRRAARKLSVVLGFPGATPLGQSQAAAIRADLWKDEAVRHIMAPKAMRSAELFDERHLIQFLDASQRPRFPYEGQWQRMISLEVALQAVHELRQNAAAAEPMPFHA